MKNKPMPEWYIRSVTEEMSDYYKSFQHEPSAKKLSEICFNIMSQRQGWQPIETCPKDDEVFVQTPNGFFVAYNDSEYGWCSLGIKPLFFKKFNPKMWMPIPEVGE